MHPCRARGGLGQHLSDHLQNLGHLLPADHAVPVHIVHPGVQFNRLMRVRFRDNLSIGAANLDMIKDSFGDVSKMSNELRP